MPRLRDHVKALVRQLDTLEASISGLQNELQVRESGFCLKVKFEPEPPSANG